VRSFWKNSIGLMDVVHVDPVNQLLLCYTSWWSGVNLTVQCNVRESLGDLWRQLLSLTLPHYIRRRTTT